MPLATKAKTKTELNLISCFSFSKKLLITNSCIQTNNCIKLHFHFSLCPTTAGSSLSLNLIQSIFSLFKISIFCSQSLKRKKRSTIKNEQCMKTFCRDECLDVKREASLLQGNKKGGR